ncbi:MAG: hypothetical protein ACRDEA_00880 [Microcystaceae cyanobacterium]
MSRNPPSLTLTNRDRAGLSGSESQASFRVSYLPGFLDSVS